ncbi:hypothetical protein, partial [Paenarthrobacter sp. NPDC057981]|uniref:hypothetical protein n=1 Tax=Paenarthrobacter sp. NPDC057981 TaxID=3346297 RepID=UPI0036DF79BE
FFGMAFMVVSWCQYGSLALWGVVVGNVSGVLVVGVVFGALLGPEATGPFCSNAGRDRSGVSFVPASGTVGPLLGCGGLVDGVVV